MAVDLNELLRGNSPEFFPALREETRRATEFGRVVQLSTLRKRAQARGIPAPVKSPLRVAIVGGCTLRPLADLVEHFATILGEFDLQLWVGEFDNYISEIKDLDSELYGFGPEVVVVIPSESRCRFTGTLLNTVGEQRAQAEAVVDELLGLCRTIRDGTGGEVVLGNFRLPPEYDPGPARYTSLASSYAFRKYVNTQLGLKTPSYVHICDVEFLANRLGTDKAADERTWFESKQPFAMEFAVAVAREMAHVLRAMREPPKKVVVLDLDNTLWGGVVGDDGLEGIEIGTTSPRGEAFRAFQQYLLSLTERGVLLAICSKNDHEKAVEPFLRHPEMVLRLSNIVSFKANWEPKSENIKQIALELNLGLDSFVFVDDNPAEIEIVRQFVPAVTCICAGDDPSLFTRLVQDERLFEYRSITQEDVGRVELYRQEAKRQELQSTATDMDAYLASLEMVADISSFTRVDAPRISQLINKSNQFNLTTRRRTEAEVLAVAADPDFSAFTVRLSDRFGDHGLIAVVVGSVDGPDFLVDTWLMSCRVLKRQVEELTLNEIVRRARERSCRRIVGVYRPTAKNAMVRELYPRLGFSALESIEEEARFVLDVEGFEAIDTRIKVLEVPIGSK